MKKRQGFINWILFVLFFGLSLFIFSAGSVVQATTADGKLQLDPNVLTNSGGGIGITGDFPIRNRLFTPELDQQAKKLRVDSIPEQEKKLNFSDSTLLYDADVTKVTKTLFTADYQPLAIKTGTDEGKRSNALWYGLIIAAGVVLTVLAVFLGRWRAKRRVRRKR